VDEFTGELKVFLEQMRQLDSTVVDDLRTTIDDLNASLYFYSKFNDVWDSLKIKDRVPGKNQVGQIRNFAWLIFIIARGTAPLLVHLPVVRLLKRTKNLAELAYMLSAVIIVVLTSLPREVTCEMLDCTASLNLIAVIAYKKDYGS